MRPPALSPDRSCLFVADIANGSLDVLRVTDEGLAVESSVHVGVDPVGTAGQEITYTCLPPGWGARR